MTPTAAPGEGNATLPIIEINDDVRSFVMARGGTLYLRVRQNRCCSGAMTFLDADVALRVGRGSYLSCDSESLKIQLLDAGLGFPRQITVELRGKIRPRLVAYWDGCAYRM